MTIDEYDFLFVTISWYNVTLPSSLFFSVTEIRYKKVYLLKDNHKYLTIIYDMIVQITSTINLLKHNQNE